MNLTNTEENYLKIIYKLSDNNEKIIGTKILAQALNVNAASVTEKLQNMAKKSIIIYEKSKGVKLTEEGIKTALMVIRKHRIWETFLVKKLKFGWEEVHEIAEQLEHINSDKLIERIEELLNFPAFDPHGEPIPNRKGVISKPCFKTLNELCVNETCRIAAVKSDDKIFLKYFNKLGLKIGDTIVVLGIEDFNKAMKVKVNKKQISEITNEVTNNIWVTFNEKCCVFESNNIECLHR